MEFTLRVCLLTPLLALCITCLGMRSAAAEGLGNHSAEMLRAKYVELSPKLVNNQFKRPLFLDSLESSSHLKGDIYALVDYPFAVVNEALNGPAHWCDVLILHINVKYCQASTNKSKRILAVSIGKKDFQPLDQAYRVDFSYVVFTSAAEYFDVGLNAATGPMGTSDYRIRLEAVSVQDDKTFLHLTYSYDFNFAGRLAMQAYLATIGSGKVGFTSMGKQSSGQADYIGGVRGVVERNTMRYYLAIDAYLSALSTPLAQQLEKRLQNWFALTELYPRQLHEVERATYLDMKLREYSRQQKTP